MAERGALSIDGVAVEVDLAAPAAGEAAIDPAVLRSNLDGEHWGLARALSASFDDGLAIAVLALRPTGAGGHGEESVAAILTRGEEATAVDEALLSVEYDPDGAPRRVGLELYESPDALPMRIAGDRAAAASAPGDTAFEMRHGGVPGRGRLTVVRPG